MNFYVPKSVLGIRGKTMKETKSQLLQLGERMVKDNEQRNVSVPSGNKWCEEERVCDNGGGRGVMILHRKDREDIS